MPTLQCPNCGNKVTFEGLAGVCPNCASVVRLPAAPTPAKPRPPAVVKSSSRRVKLADLEEIGGQEEEVFDPHAPQRPRKKMDPGVLYTLIGTGTAIFIFVLYLILRPSLEDTTTAVAPPPPSFHVSGPSAPLPSVPQNNNVITVVPVQPVTAPATQVVVKPSTRPEWMGLKPVRPTLPSVVLSDATIGQAIQKAANLLVTQLDTGDLAERPRDPQALSGERTLCTYALLHAGKAVLDPRLGISSPFMQMLLDRVKKFDMTGPHATYERSLRASALELAGRSQDQSTLARDMEWLIKSSVKGAFNYTPPAKDARPEDFRWDNSNSQYGVLGIWAAADAGLSVPPAFWDQVEQHWILNQNADGGWGYTKGDASTLSMTCAGVTTLAVAAEQRSQALMAHRGQPDPRPALTNAAKKGLAWLDKDDNSVNVGSAGYTYYGLERAALATGFKWFGQHDWFSELAAKVVQSQNANGAWAQAGGDIETAFRLLFLARGRQPLMMNKLRFDGNWNNRPRDASKLSDFVSAQLEQPFAWGVVDLSRNPWEWLDAPLLYMSTDTPPDLSDDDFAKIRDYTNQGGLIFIHNEWASPAMDQFVETLAAKAFPEYPLQELPPDHLIYSDVIHLNQKTPLKGVSNGSRLLVLYSPTDITKAWVTRRPKDDKNPESQLGLNIFVYAAGKDGFRKRLESPYIPPPKFPAIGTVPIIRVQYPGSWDPEPGGWPRFSRWFQNESSIALSVLPVPMQNLSTTTPAPVAVLTGNTATDFSQMDIHPLHDFVANGGVLLIDSTGGSKAFIKSIREQLLPRAFPEAQPAPVPDDQPILVGTGACMDPLPKIHLRRYAAEQLDRTAPALDYLTVGKGTVIVSDIDLTTGLVGTGNYGIVGYTPAYAQSLVKNVILWTLGRY